LFFAAFWLPLQAVAATAMPFCRHGEAHRSVPTMAMAEGMAHCALHGSPAATPAPSDHDDHRLSCDDCGFCHLAAAAFMPIAESDVPLLPVSRDYQFRPEPSLVSAIPEPPQHPPKRTT
jgi:hypothetical protein